MVVVVGGYGEGGLGKERRLLLPVRGTEKEAHGGLVLSGSWGVGRNLSLWFFAFTWLLESLPCHQLRD